LHTQARLSHAAAALLTATACITNKRHLKPLTTLSTKLSDSRQMMQDSSFKHWKIMAQNVNMALAQD